MELGRFLSRFRPLVPVHAVFDLEFLTLFLLYLTVRWTPLLGDLLAIGFFPVIHIICLWGERRFLLGGGAAAVLWERRFLLVHLPQALCTAWGSAPCCSATASAPWGCSFWP